MKYRTTHLLAEKTLTGSGTETLSINLNQPISRISIGYRENMGDNNMEAQLGADLTSIELVDGSDVLFSLNGLEAQALGIYNRRVSTMNHGQYIPANSMYGLFPIDFGRWLWDPELAFDPTKFDNPQLKVTYDVDVACDATTTSYLEVWADVFDEKIIAPGGFLMTKEVMNYTCGSANSYEYVDIPTDYPIRQLLLRGYRSAYEPWYQIIEARLNEDNDRRVVFDWDLEDYHRIMKGTWNPVIEQCIGYIHGASGYNKFVTPTDYYVVAAGIPNASTNVFYASTYFRGGFLDIEADDSTMFIGMVYGWLPNHCWQFPFGNQQDINDWYDVTDKKSIELRLKSGTSGTSGTGQVIAEQYRAY